MFPLAGGGFFPTGVGGGETEPLFGVAAGESRKILQLVQIHFAVAGDGFNDPKSIGVLVPEQYIGHGIAEFDIESCPPEGCRVLVHHAVAIARVNVQNFEGGKKPWAIDLNNCCDEVFTGGFDASRGGLCEVGLDFEPGPCDVLGQGRRQDRLGRTGRFEKCGMPAGEMPTSPL